MTAQTTTRTARYAGTCDLCGERFPAGTEVSADFRSHASCPRHDAVAWVTARTAAAAASLRERNPGQPLDSLLSGIAASAGTVDEAAVTEYLAGAADAPRADRIRAARRLWSSLRGWSPALAAGPVAGTPVDAATLAEIIDRLEA